MSVLFIKRLTLSVLTLLLIYLAINFLRTDEYFSYTIWADRDLVRAANMLDSPQYLGAELNYVTSRVPGGVYYYVLAVPLLISGEPSFVFFWTVLLNLALLVAFLVVTYRYFSLFTAVVAGLYVLGSRFFDTAISQLWNPSYSFVFIFPAYIFYIRYLHQKRHVDLALATVMIMFAGQVQLGALSLLSPLILHLLWHFQPRQTNWQRVMLSVVWVTVGVLLAFLPYWIGEIVNDFENTDAIFTQNYFLIEQHGQNGVEKLIWVINYFWSLQSGDPDIPLKIHSLAELLRLQILILLATSFFVVLIAPHRWLRQELSFSDTQWKIITFCWVVLGFVLFYAYAYAQPYDAARYYVYAAPAAALLLGLTVDVIMRQLEKTSAIRYLLGGAFILAAITGSALQFQTDVMNRGGNYQENRDRLAWIIQETGWTTSEIAARISFWSLNAADQPVDIFEHSNIDYELLRSGDWFMGSAGETGGLMIKDWYAYHTDPPTADELFVLRNQYFANHSWFTAPYNTVLQSPQIQMVSRWNDDLFLTYQVTDALPMTNLDNPYVFSPEEQQMLSLYADLSSEDVSKTTEQNKVIYVAKVYENLMLYISVQLDGDSYNYALHSNQLGSNAPTVGFADRYMIASPTLEWLNSEGEVVSEVIFAEGVVGYGGVNVPLTVSTPALAPDQYQLRLTTIVFPKATPETPQEEAIIPLQLFLDEAFTAR